MNRSILLFLMVCIINVVNAQDNSINYEVELSNTTSFGKYTPLWLNSNRYGLSSLELNNGYIRTAISKPLSKNKRFDYGGAIDLVGAYHFSSPFYIQQAYLEIKYRSLRFWVGSRELEPELHNPLLSTGDMTFSMNARPIPQVYVGIPEYLAIPKTNKSLYIKGGLSYGRFSDDRYQKEHAWNEELYTTDILYHRKYFYLKYENEHYPVYGIFGAEMDAQFGGTMHYDGKCVKIPSSWKEYFKVFVPLPGGAENPLGDQVNIVGNQIGSYHFLIGYKTATDRVQFYFNNIFEDHSGMIFQNFPDGIWTLEWLRNKKSYVSGVLAQLIYTTNQSGPFLHDPDDLLNAKAAGADNYYNNYAYPGWSHWGMAIGNPLLISPAYNDDGTLYFKNNRVQALHIGAHGYAGNQWHYRVLATWSINYGRYAQPYIPVRRNLSLMAECTWTPERFAGWKLKLGLGSDHGDLIGNNFGMQLSLKKSGNLFKF